MTRCRWAGRPIGGSCCSGCAGILQPPHAIDFAHPPPEPPPVTTIAWRLAHVTVGVFAMRNHSHFGGPPADYVNWPYAADAEIPLSINSTMPIGVGIGAYSPSATKT